MEKIIHVLLRIGLFISLCQKKRWCWILREENHNLLESINDLKVYQWLQMSILAVHMNIAKEKNTSLVSLQHVSYPAYSLYFTSLCNIISHINHFIYCNKSVTIKLGKKLDLNTSQSIFTCCSINQAVHAKHLKLPQTCQ